MATGTKPVARVSIRCIPLAAKVDSTGPEVRPEVVERGKALVANPNWPDDDVLGKLAEKLIDSDDFGS